MTEEVWLPIVKRVCPMTGRESYIPALPAGKRIKVEMEMPCDLDPASENYGKPYCSHAPVHIHVGNRKDFTAAISEKEVPEETVLAIRMMRACRGGWNEKAPAFFYSIPSVIDADFKRKRMIKRLLMQAVLRPRGLSAAKAEEIRAALNLPEGEVDHGQSAASGRTGADNARV